MAAVGFPMPSAEASRSVRIQALWPAEGSMKKRDADEDSGISMSFGTMSSETARGPRARRPWISDEIFED
ncbi:hypothetical protein NXC24_PA00021 (plasmid) [Rhizobium sp. NXC24]|nr:hypothetical protein NXC24_PA00021 [Rhizobium sp. NXC24]